MPLSLYPSSRLVTRGLPQGPWQLSNRSRRPNSQHLKPAPSTLPPVLSGNPIVPPRDYSKGLQRPKTEDYNPIESGTIYDIAFLGIENGEVQFEVRGYSIEDLDHPATGQTLAFPQEQKSVEIRDIVIEIEDVQEGSVTYKIAYRK